MAEDNDNCWAYRSVCRCRIICRVCALCILCPDCQILRIRRMFDCRRSTLLNRNHSGFARKRTGDQTSDSVWICVRHVVLVSDYRRSQLNSSKLASLRGWTRHLTQFPVWLFFIFLFSLRGASETPARQLSSTTPLLSS